MNEKIALFICVIVLMIGACKSDTRKKNIVSEHKGRVILADMPKTEIVFDVVDYDFGVIKEGDLVSHTYKFKNTGKEPLIIKQTRTACGCTTTSVPTTPILPGEEGEISISFNSQNKVGANKKEVRVYCNVGKGVVILSFKADVQA